MQTKDISDWLVIVAHLEFRRINMALWPYQILNEWLNAPEKVAFRAMERACKRDFIDFGVSLRTGWPTKEGLDMLSDSIQYKIKNQTQYDAEYETILAKCGFILGLNIKCFDRTQP